MKIFITGASGFIGQQLVARLLSNGVEKIYVLQRRLTNEDQRTNDRIVPVQGDITCDGVITNELIAQEVRENVTVLIHAAAVYKVDVELYPAYMTNIVGTQNILNFASKCPNLEYFHYLSTVAVKGLFKFDLFEDPLKFPKTNYLDNYSYTKAAAESLVKKADLGEIKKRIYRPGAVIGDTKTGTVEKIDGPYYFLAWLERHPLLTHLVRLLPIIPLPVSPETPLPFIAVDVLCDWLEMMILRPQERDSIRIYNMVSREPIPYSDFLEAVKEHYRLKGRFVSITNHTFAVLVGKFFSMPHQLISYMNSTGYFTTQNRADDYPSLEDFHFKSMIDSFFAGTSRFFQNKENQK